MKKSIIIVTVLILFTFVNIVPTTKAGSLVNLSSYLRAGFDASNFSSKPIVPGGETRSLTMYFDYGVNYAGLFKNLAQLILQFHRNKQVNIRIELGDHSPWCTPTLFTDTITTKVAVAEETGLQVTLNLRLDLDAPAYGPGFINIKATVPKVGMIAGYNNTYTLEFTPAYLSLIKTETPEGNYRKIRPYNETVIPIDITNFGNGRTRVRAEIENASGKLNVSITDQVMLDIGSTERAYLKVLADHKFESESINIKLTPERAESPADVGSPHYVSFLFENDGSYKTDEKEFEINTTLILIVIIIILVMIIVVILLKNRIKQ